ncbi:hypothetical protein C8F04DRAFT_1193218 [Mycena alexandri]|uniref:Uncharacterized protein n=1 Tax=Mycena alexandri TaxID=1745969 RepID=A0AAD6WUB7_9AGAR|nr:hypothetical protein C8F04DRAFT_1193218 [Mycena alexandri]
MVKASLAARWTLGGTEAIDLPWPIQSDSLKGVSGLIVEVELHDRLQLKVSIELNNPNHAENPREDADTLREIFGRHNQLLALLEALGGPLLEPEVQLELTLTVYSHGHWHFITDEAPPSVQLACAGLCSGGTPASVIQPQAAAFLGIPGLRGEEVGRILDRSPGCFPVHHTIRLITKVVIQCSLISKAFSTKISGGVESELCGTPRLAKGVVLPFILVAGCRSNAGVEIPALSAT